MPTCLCTGSSVVGDDEKSLGAFLRLTLCSRWLTFPQEQIPIAIRRYNSRTIEEVNQNVTNLPADFNFAAPGIVVKWSWVSLAAEDVESDLLRECSDLFGTPKHYYSFLACHGNDSPATNHLFLPGDDSETTSCYWNISRARFKSPERRGLRVYISSFSGESLLKAPTSKTLIRAVLHACLGMCS